MSKQSIAEFYRLDGSGPFCRSCQSTSYVKCGCGHSDIPDFERWTEGWVDGYYARDPDEARDRDYMEAYCRGTKDYALDQMSSTKEQR